MFGLKNGSRKNDMYLIDGSILMHPKAWEASGHTVAFTDPLIQCQGCKKRLSGR